MKNIIFLLALFLSAYFRKATTEVETVWLKDVTTKLQTEKRTLSDPDLPDQLYFRLRRKSHGVTLNLKRNYQINPNVDIYTVQILNDGRPKLEKTQNLEKEDVAYYQDIENGAYMTARCVKRSSGQCDILINGNIRIGDRMYDLQPLEAHTTSRNLMKITSLLGKQYVLQDQESIQRKMSVGNKEETNVNEKNVEGEFRDRHQLILDGQYKQKHFLHPDVKLLKRNDASLHNAFATRENSYRKTNSKNDQIRNLRPYYVEVVVLTDSSIYDLFLTMAVSLNPSERDIEAKTKIRDYFSHIINGVDMLYRGIQHSGIIISVILRALVILETPAQFQHERSKVNIYHGFKLVDASDYLTDLGKWDKNIGLNQLPQYDQIILFTKYELYEGIFTELLNGLSITKGVCKMGDRVQVNRVDHYFLTVSLAAHELGHALGAEHDGDKGAESCSPDDRFIMTPEFSQFELYETNFMNPWLFSSCSVKSFTKTLRKRNCTLSKGKYSQAILNEWAKTMLNPPGELFTVNEQCRIIFGSGSTYCGKEPGMICRFMRCKLPRTGECGTSHLTAATGTPCGQNHWCSAKGLCVPKGSQ